MSRRYEVVYIFDSSLEEPQVTEHLARFHALLASKDNPEPRVEINHWGKRTLAYPIKHREVGYYVITKFETEPAQLSEFERLIKLDESVLRHLVVIDEGATPAAAVRASDDEDVMEIREELEE